MAVSFNSVVGFNSTANYQHVSRATGSSIIRRPSHLTSSPATNMLLSPANRINLGFCLSVADGDCVVTDTNNKAFKNAERYLTEGSPAVNPPSLDPSNRDDEVEPKVAGGAAAQLSELTNNSTASGNSEQDAPSAYQKSALKRSPLTAREKLRAARVLSRYTESKASKPAMGSKLLDALRESDKGKQRSGLPEAPTNLFDDSKRGMPKPGWTFELPVGLDVFLIAFSFVFISTVMFATTYIVWKVGAIHFNEY